MTKVLYVMVETARETPSSLIAIALGVPRRTRSGGSSIATALVATMVGGFFPDFVFTSPYASQGQAPRTHPVG